jgi:hypothetical protein
MLIGDFLSDGTLLITYSFLEIPQVSKVQYPLQPPKRTCLSAMALSVCQPRTASRNPAPRRRWSLQRLVASKFNMNLFDLVEWLGQH